jgi:hypothetical protein
MRQGPGFRYWPWSNSQLHDAAEFGVGVAAPQRPVPAAGAVLVLQDLHLVAGLAELDRGDHAGEAGTEDQHLGAARVALQARDAAMRRFLRMAEAGHRLVHHGTARDGADHRQ